jgi:hypothetical protein
MTLRLSRAVQALVVSFVSSAVACSGGGSNGEQSASGGFAAVARGGAGAAAPSGAGQGGSAGGMLPGGAGAGVVGSGGAGQRGAGGSPSGTAGTSSSGGASGRGAGARAAGAGGAASGSGGSAGQAAAGTGAASGAAGAHAAGAGGAPAVDDSRFKVSAMLASDVDMKAPATVGIVTWSAATLTPKSAHLEFGLDTSYGMIAPVDLGQPDYRTLLLGMKPNKTYHFRVVASDGSAEHASGDYTLRTGAATTAVKISKFDVKEDSGRERGFIVLSYWAGSGSSVAFILDADGDIVWAYDTGMSGGIARARISYSGHDLWAVTADNAGQPIRRVGMDGLNPQTYSSTKSSHDIAAVSGDTMAYLDYSVSCNDINEIEPSGTTKKIFTASTLFGSQCHGNALRYSEAEDNYSFGVVDKDIIRVSRTGEKLWSLASTVSGGNASWGGVNHGHHLLASSILIFANKGGANGSSAMLEYDFSGKKLASYEDGTTSQNLGDVQRLPGGNLLIDFSNAGVVREVSKDGKVLVEITAASSQNKFGYATWRPTLYGASPDITD